MGNPYSQSIRPDKNRMANYPSAPAYDALTKKTNWSMKVKTNPDEDRFAHVIASLQGERANIIHDTVKIDSIESISRKKEKDVFFRRLVHNSIIENSRLCIIQELF
jgi:hypothetical protein